MENSKFVVRLRKLRRMNDLTQGQMADELHISRSTYTGYELGNINPPSNKITQIAKFFNVSPGYLMGWDEFDKEVNTPEFQKQLRESAKLSEEELNNEISKDTDAMKINKEEEARSMREELSKKDERDIKKKLDATLKDLESSDGLMFDGEALDDETKDLLHMAIESALITAKVKAKEKFTPKKYKKED